LKKNRLLDDMPNVIEGNFPGSTVISVRDYAHYEFFDVVDSLFEKNGVCTWRNPHVSYGDFVDQGWFGMEALIILLALTILFPNSVHFIRGNHECVEINMILRFPNHVNAEYPNCTRFEIFTGLLHGLPPAFTQSCR
jgi:hypothetical protein